MYKSKDGKVYASLTEVKNKTGDIFALVDEFGEVSISSYNKVRYKIVKVDINSVIDLSETEKAKTSTPRKMPVKKEVVIPTRDVKENHKKIEAEPVKEMEVSVEEVKYVTPEPIEEIKVQLEEPQIQTNIVEEEKEEAAQSITGMIVPWDRDSREEKEFISKAVKNLN